MKNLSSRQELLIAISISIFLLMVLAIAKLVPVSSYRGFSVCRAEERYSIIRGEVDSYSERVKYFEDKDSKIDPSGKGEGAAPAIACPDYGKIELYLL